MSYQTTNPTTEEILKTYEPFNQQQIDAALTRAQQTFQQWRSTTFADRERAIKAVAAHLRERKGELAKHAVLEMGKSITEAEAEVEKCAWTCDYFAENAEKMLADQVIKANAQESYVAFRPLGVVLAVMPWNFPYWQVFRFAAPGLMAGNVAILKHASNVSGVSLEIEKIFQQAGLPEGCFQTVLVPGKQTKALIEDPRIAAVTLTGSESAGVEVAATSGQVLKKTVLELGGSDAYIVLKDADLDQAAEIAVTARFQNNGQSCIAAKRFIVEEAVAEEFEHVFAEQAARLKVGDPLEHDTRIGPLARKDLRETLDEQVRKSVKQGAKVLIGGKPREGQGYFYEPTILTYVTPEMSVFSEETFGPVAAVIRARDAEHAIELANNSKFGLSSNLWTQDLEQARRLAARIEAGGVFINGMTASDPRLPFGGVKASGYGRELSHFGVQEFVNIQTVWIGPKSDNPPTKTVSE